MEEIVTAREAARRLERPARTVQEWAERGEVEGVQKAGTSWVAPWPAWQASAKIERRVGPKKKHVVTRQSRG